MKQMHSVVQHFADDFCGRKRGAPLSKTLQTLFFDSSSHIAGTKVGGKKSAKYFDPPFRYFLHEKGEKLLSSCCTVLISDAWALANQFAQQTSVYIAYLPGSSAKAGLGTTRQVCKF